VPDLVRGPGGAYELPLWFIQPGRPRRRLHARYAADRVELLADAEVVAEGHCGERELVEQILALAGRGWLIAPRAITLTMFLRLFMAELFIHGAGGARYDLPGDELCQGFFGLRPPAHLTATATLRLDLPSRPVTTADLSAARWRLHHWRHNPMDFYAGDGAARAAGAEGADEAGGAGGAGGVGEIGAAAAALRRLPGRIAQAPPLSAERAALFAEMRQLKEHLRQRDRRGERLAAGIERLVADLQQRKLAWGREYFYALFPTERLMELARRTGDYLRRGSGDY